MYSLTRFYTHFDFTDKKKSYLQVKQTKFVRTFSFDTSRIWYHEEIEVFHSTSYFSTTRRLYTSHEQPRPLVTSFNITLAAGERVVTLTITYIVQVYTYRNTNEQNKLQIYLWPTSNVVSADNIATTVKAWDRQPHSFASNKVLDNEGSSGSSAKDGRFQILSKLPRK